MDPFKPIFKVSSFIFMILFLEVLLFLAFIKHLVQRAERTQDKSERLDPRERRLVKDIGYYIELAGFKYYPLSVHTEDGYVLDIGRILGPDGQASNGATVLLIPGLMQSSGAYVTAGPRAIALELARAGYDVWLGNNRGGFKGEHSEFNRWFNNKMWQWDMNDLARFDVPKLVETVLEGSGRSKLAIVGHSQGTCQTFLALSNQFTPELASKISSFSALAPAVYAGNLIDRWYLRLLRHGPKAWRSMMGYGPFLGCMFSLEKLLPHRIAAAFGYAMFNYLLGWNDLLWDRRYRDRNFVFSPVYVSSKHMEWWLGRDGFADTRCALDESSPQWFQNGFPPLQLFICGRDELCNGPRLVNRIKTMEPIKDVDVVDLPAYAHLDVLWARDADEMVAAPLVEFIGKHSSQPTGGRRVDSSGIISRARTPEVPSPALSSLSSPQSPTPLLAQSEKHLLKVEDGPQVPIH